MTGRRHGDVALPLEPGEKVTEVAPKGKRRMLLKTDRGRAFQVIRAKSGRYLVRGVANG